MTFKPESMLDIVPAELTVQVGNIVTQWAWTEAFADSLIWRLLGVGMRKGRAVTSHLPAQAKFQMLATLLRLRRFNETVTKKVLKDGLELSGLRNLVAHGYIASHPTMPIATLISFAARGQFQNRSRLVTESLLKKTAVKMATCNIYLLEELYEPLRPRKERPVPKLRYPNDPRRRMQAILRRLPPPLLPAEDVESGE